MTVSVFKKIGLAVIVAVVLAGLGLAVWSGIPTAGTDASAATDTVWTTGTQSSKNLVNMPSGGSEDPMGQSTLQSLGWNGISGQINPNPIWYENAKLETPEYGWGIQAQGSSDDIGNSDYENGVWIRIPLSVADQVKANKGDLFVSAASLNYEQGIWNHYCSLKLFFDNESGTQLSYVSVQKKIDGSAYPLNIDNHAVPVGTASIRYYVSNHGGGTARPFIGGMQCYLIDKTAPKATGAVLSGENGGAAPDYAVPGTRFSYCVKFDEKVNVTQSGTAVVALNDAQYTSNNAVVEQKTDGTTEILYSFVLPQTASGETLNRDGTIDLQAINGLSATDEGVNLLDAASVSAAVKNAATLQFYGIKSVTANVSGLTFSGQDTAVYGKNYSAAISARVGYRLPSSIRVEVGGSLLALGQYTFNTDTGEFVIAGQYVTGNIEISASGVGIAYSVSYDANKPIGASGTVAGSMANTEHVYDSPKALRPNGFGLTGWTFDGWATSPTGQKVYDNNQVVSNLSATEGAIVRLYARWVPNTYTVQYNANRPAGASGSVEGVTTDSSHTYDTLKALTANGFSLTGWTFTGWATTAQGGKAYDDRQEIATLAATDGATVTLYAVWTANTYTVTYNADKPGNASAGVAGTTSDSAHTYDAEKALTTNGYSLTGWAFQGWATEPGGQKVYDNGRSVVNLTAEQGARITLYAVWTANTYTVTYNADKPGNASASVAGTTSDSAHTYDAEKALTANGFSLTGWTFQGWATESGGQKIYDDGRSVVNLAAEQGGTVTLFAVWKANTYTVTYDSDKPIGASGAIEGDTANSSHTYDTSSALTANGYRLTGWRFVGWATEPGGGKTYTDAQSVSDLTATTNGSVTLYAVWEANAYTVTYNANKPIGASGTVGGATSNSLHTYDTQAALTANGYSLTGWTFQGWATSPTGGTSYDDSQTVVNLTTEQGGTVMLYAVWTANTYTVTYDSNKPDGASGSVEGVTESSVHTYDTEKALTANGYALTGWTFGGWATAPSGEKIYGDSQSVVNLTAEQGGAVTLYAVWTANVYTIHYNSAGGSGSGSKTVTYDGALPALPLLPSRHGYNFLGYFTEVDGAGICYYDGEGQVEFDGNYVTVGDLTLYAHWKPVTYTVTLYSEGNYLHAIECTFGSLILPSAQTLGLTRKNYDFVGWNIYDEQNWSMYAAEKEYKVGLTAEQGAEVTVYAAWQEKPVYLLSFDANGGTGAPAMLAIHRDETVALPEQEPEREHYTFLGWATDPHGEATYVAGSAFTMGDGASTLHAVWAKNPSLSYDANGGAFYTEVNIVYPESGQTVSLTSVVPHRTGFEFVGWSWDKEGSAGDCIDSVVMPAEDSVLYAVWQKLRYTVSVRVPDGYSVEGIEDGAEVEYGTEIRFGVVGESPLVFIDGVSVSAVDGFYTHVVTAEIEIRVSDGTELFLLYSANGGSGAPVDRNGYVAGQSATIVRAADLVRTGYAFLGWATEETATEPSLFEGNTVEFVDRSVTLYAVWKANTYTVAYESEGSAAETVSTFRYDEASLLAPNPFEKTGHTFAGWATSEQGDPVYADGAEICNLAEADGARITLYAVWKKTVTTVTFDQAGGTDGSESMAIAFGTVPETDTVLPPVRTGYVFLGYFTAPEGGVQVFDADMKPVYTFDPGRSSDSLWLLNEEEITLYAVYAGVSYTVVYFSGSDRLGSQAAVYGEAFRLLSAASLGVQVPDHYTFAGWSVVPEGTVAYNDQQQIVNGLAETEGAEFCLYAVSEEDQKVSIRYDGNGGMDAPVDPTLYYVGSEIVLSPDVPQKEGYVFKGWGYDNKTVAFSYTDGAFAPDRFTASEDVRLYAVWEAGETLQSQIDRVEGAVDALNTAVAGLQAEDVALGERIDGMQAALEEAIGAMQSPDETFATDEELAAAIAALKSAYEQADAALQSAVQEVQNNLDAATELLQASIASGLDGVNDTIAALDAAYKNADALINADLAALEDADAALEASFVAADAALQTAIDNVSAALETKAAELEEAIAANESDIEAKVTALDIAYKNADALINADLAALEDADAALKASCTAADAALQTAIDNVSAALETKAAELEEAIAANESDIEAKVTALDTAYKNADALINADLAALEDADAALEASFLAADAALQGAIDRVNAALEAKAAELEEAIAANESDIEAKVAALDTAYKNADALINADLAALEDADDALEASFVAADAALQTAIDRVNAALEAKATELEESIASNESDIEAKVNALDSAYKAADALINSDLATLLGQSEALSSKMVALESAYKAADRVLTEGLENLRAQYENLDGKNKELADKLADLEAETAKTERIYRIINISLGALCGALAISLIARAILRAKARRSGDDQ